MKISVITVCFNASGLIERTIRSVLAQTSKDFEYLIIDGGSTDGTVNIIKQYSDNLSFWCSEKDSGIYNAMNKGVRAAKGDFCLFLNAGDMLFDKDTLEKVSAYLSPEYSVVMGNQIFLSPDGRIVEFGKVWPAVTRVRMFYDSPYHQASFTNRNDLLEFPFDESLKMVSDWEEAFILLVLKGKKYLPIDVTVDYFVQDGLTFTQSEKGIAEKRCLLDRYYSENEQKMIADYLKRKMSLLNPCRYFTYLTKIITLLLLKLSVKTPAL